MAKYLHPCVYHIITDQLPIPHVMLAFINMIKLQCKCNNMQKKKKPKDVASIVCSGHHVLTS